MTSLMILGAGLTFAAILGLVPAPRVAMARGSALALRSVDRLGHRPDLDDDADESEAADPAWASFMRAM